MEKQLYGLSVCEKLEKLIRVPSTTPPGEVSGVVELLANFAEKTGAALERQEVLPGQENCILTYDFGAGKTLVFNTHMDVNNPAGQRWSFEPFNPFQKDGKIFGMGACDASSVTGSGDAGGEEDGDEDEGEGGGCVETTWGE